MKNRAFSLIEIIIVTAIVAAASPVFFTQARSAIYEYKLIRDKRIAQSRIACVKAVLKMPLLHCGIFMASDKTEYKTNFASQSTPPFSWSGPISTGVKSASRNGYSLRIAYAVKSSYIVKDPVHIGKSSQAVTFCQTVQTSDFSTTKTDVKSRVFFPNSYPEYIPFRVTAISGKTLSLLNSVSDDVAICQNDRLYHFCAIECFENNGIFYTKDFRTAGDQPRTAGIILFDFELDKEKKIVKCYIAARGDNKEFSGKIIGKELFPSDVAAKIPDVKYMVVCSTMTVPLINYDKHY